jgi:hypothetical protein
MKSQNLAKPTGIIHPHHPQRFDATKGAYGTVLERWDLGDAWILSAGLEKLGDARSREGRGREGANYASHSLFGGYLSPFYVMIMRRQARTTGWFLPSYYSYHTIS